MIIIFDCLIKIFLDTDECSENNGGCQHVCNNTEGSFACSCNEGYVLAEDRLSCNSEFYAIYAPLDNQCFSIQVLHGEEFSIPLL